MFGGQVGVGGHLTIGRGAVAVGQSGVTNSLRSGAMVAGYPAIDSREWRRASVVFRRLPELKRRIEELERRLAALSRRPRGEPLETVTQSEPRRSWRLAARRCALLVACAVHPAAAQIDDASAAAAGTVEFLPRVDFISGRASRRVDDPRFVWDAQLRRRASMSSTTGTAGPRSWPTTRRCSATSSARSIPTRATTCSRCPCRFARALSSWRGVFSPSVAPPGRSRQARGRGLEHAGRPRHSCAAQPGTDAGSTCAPICEERCEVVRRLPWELDPGCAARRAPFGRTSASSAGGGIARVWAWTAPATGALRPAVAGRAASGSRAEGGAMELFVAAERRIDPYQLEFSTRRG